MALYRDEAIRALARTLVQELYATLDTEHSLTENALQLSIQYIRDVFNMIVFLWHKPQNYIFEDKQFNFISRSLEAILLWNQLYPLDKIQGLK